MLCGPFTAVEQQRELGLRAARFLLARRFPLAEQRRRPDAGAVETAVGQPVDPDRGKIVLPARWHRFDQPGADQPLLEEKTVDPASFRLQGKLERVQLAESLAVGACLAQLAWEMAEEPNARDALRLVASLPPLPLLDAVRPILNLEGDAAPVGEQRECPVRT